MKKPNPFAKGGKDTDTKKGGKPPPFPPKKK